MYNEYFYSLAERAAQKAAEYGLTIDPRWIYAQWCHETGGFTSELQASNHNLGGLTQSQPNDTPQPDGKMYYINFATFEDYADYFGWYIAQYQADGIYEAQTMEEYITALCNGGYFGDSLKNYLAGTTAAYEEAFA